MSKKETGNAKISVVRSLADILSVCVSVFLVLSMLHTVICLLFFRICPSGL